MKTIILVASFFSFIAGICAQTSQMPSPLDPTKWGVVYDIPETKRVKIRADIKYSKDLTIDIYLPPNAKSEDRFPAVVFLNAIGDGPNNKLKNWEIYRSFPRLIAAHGMAGISMEADSSNIQECLARVFDFLEKEGARLGIDPNRLGVYAASANTTQSLVYLMGDGAAKGIRAAALFYGASPAPQSRIRNDLPVLFILAEGDIQGLGQQSLTLWQRVAEARAPWTLLFASGMIHAFDAFQDDDKSRRVIMQSIAFWKSHLEPVPQPDWKPSATREIVAATYGSDHQRTVTLLAKYIADNPRDAQAYVLYARSLGALGKLEESVAALERAVSLDGENLAGVSGLGQARLSQKRYSEAEQLLSKAIAGGYSWLYSQLASAQLSLNRNAEAIGSYEKALEIGISPGPNTRGTIYFNMACLYVRLKRIDDAFEFLSKAVGEGFGNRATYENDSDLAPLRDDERFRKLLARFPNSGV